ncbi:MAG: ubiquinone/menaquinone biosynthesis methyltransferase [Acidimicrobiales bacterium]|nr:ubiquinone/menaquinone biosynthesis methyltransferase [Acidimicrobiales bacterium]
MLEEEIKVDDHICLYKNLEPLMPLGNRSPDGTSLANSKGSVLPADEEKAAVVEAMFDKIASRYESLNQILTFGLDKKWRKITLKYLGVQEGSRVLDVACGTGDFLRLLEKQNLKGMGLDFSLGMLQNAQVTSPLIRGDAQNLPFKNASLDGVTCGFALRNLTDISEFFQESSRVLKTGGRIALVDVGEPVNPLMKAGHAIWFKKAVPIIGGLLSDKTAYKYLPQSTAYLPSSKKIMAMLEDSGFIAIRHSTFLGGSAQLFSATRSVYTQRTQLAGN